MKSVRYNLRIPIWKELYLRSSEDVRMAVLYSVSDYVTAQIEASLLPGLVSWNIQEEIVLELRP